MEIIKRNGHHPEPFEFMKDWPEEFGRFLSHPMGRRGFVFRSLEPRIDLKEETDRFIVKADIPGIAKEDLEIEVEGRLLTLKGERKEETEKKEKDYYCSERVHGSFARVVELPCEVKSAEAKASMKDGVLELILPKTEAAKSKRVKVEVK